MKKVLVVLLVFILLSACSSEKETSPSEVVSSLFKHAENGEFTEMEQYISSSLLSVMNEAGYELNAYAEDITEDGEITSIEITSEKIKGEGATVYYKATYVDGKIKETEVSLIKENERWVISPSL